MSLGKETSPPSGEQGAGRPRNQEQPAAASRSPEALCYDPSVLPGSVDVTGIIPDDVQVDPEITEGHPGYDESGLSGVIPDRPPASRDANKT